MGPVAATALVVLAALVLLLAGAWLGGLDPRQAPAFAEPDDPLRHVLSGISLSQFDGDGRLLLRGTVARLAEFERPAQAPDRYQLEQLALDWRDPGNALSMPVELRAERGLAANPAQALTLRGAVTVTRAAGFNQPGWRLSGPEFQVLPAERRLLGEARHRIEAESGRWQFYGEAVGLELSLQGQRILQQGRVRDRLSPAAPKTPAPEHP